MRHLAALLYAASLFSLLAPAQAPWTERAKTGGPEFDGKVITCDLPASQHIKNIGSRVDGKGMCVTSSIEMAALWAGLEQYRGLRDWCAREPGGAYPEKVVRQLAAYAKAKGIEPVPYVQYEGPNPEPILEQLDKTGRIACITYGYGERYRGTIAHMTCAVRFRDGWAVNLDNNYPGENAYEWMTTKELVRRMKHRGRNAWVFAWLAPPPPPVPTN